MENLSILLSNARVLEHFIYVILASIWIFVPNLTCWSCPPVDDRDHFILGSSVGIVILVYSYLGACTHPYLLWIFLRDVVDYDGEGSTERDFEIMLFQEDFAGVGDMICFGDDNFKRIDREKEENGQVSILHNLCSSYWNNKGTRKEEDLRDACVAMIDNGCDVKNARNKEQLTVLHSAVKVGWTKFIEYLLEKTEAKGLINSPDSNGNAPLHFAYIHIGTKSVRRNIVKARRNKTYALKSGSGLISPTCLWKMSVLFLLNCLLSHGANESLENDGGLIPKSCHFQGGEIHVVNLFSGAYQGKTTFLMQLEGPLRYGERERNEFALYILPQMVDVVTKTLEIIEDAQKRKEEFGNDWEMYKLQGDEKEEEKDLEMSGALETMSKLKFYFWEDHKWDESIKNALGKLWENKGFQYALEKKCSALRYFFERIDEVSKPGYLPSEKDLIHMHRKTEGMPFHPFF